VLQFTKVVTILKEAEKSTKHQGKSLYLGKNKRNIIKTQLGVDKLTKQVICTSFCQGKQLDFQLFKDTRVAIKQEKRGSS